MFHKSREEIKQIAVDGAKLIKELSREYEGNFLFEYSPESFTGTEPEYAVEVCNAVLDVMQPTPDRPMIINLPVTVEMSMPHIYANQIEWCSKHLKYRDAVVLSTHPHNDRGCGVADAELAVLAGAQRVECCLFGNGGAHGQRGRHHPGHEHVQPRSGPEAGLLRYARYLRGIRAGDTDARL